MKKKFTWKSLLVLILVMIPFALIDFLQYNLPPYNLKTNSTPAQDRFAKCLEDACAARRTAERAACEASPEGPSSCSSQLNSSVTGSSCPPSRFPPTGSSAATSIETTYTTAMSSCYSKQ